ncbi:MAG: replicative DNA helicase [Dehalococcoidia bacterium]|jgi:replicative DNA helicase|nr:MAG: replicative DNA helicase [Dehalococcoidia bacterium]
MSGEKLPPHDIDAEEAVIGSLLIDGDAIYKVSGAIEPGDFYAERNMVVFEAAANLYRRNEAINPVTVAQELARTGKLDTSGGAAYLNHLISVCPTSLDVEDYANIVYRLSLMRRLIRTADEIAAIGYKASPDTDASLDRAEDMLYRLRHGQRSRDFVHIRQALDQYLETPTQEISALKETLPFIPTDFTGLDNILVGGLQRSDLIILAARPGIGKTSLALNIARNAAVNHKATVAFFSLEMSTRSVVLRLLSSEAEVNSTRLREGLFYEENPMESEEEKRRRKIEETRILEATGILSEAPIYIDDSPFLRIVEMRSKARRLFYERGSIDLIIVDYLQLLHSDLRIENRVLEIGEISRSLKALARELNAPVIAVSQLSRAIEANPTRKPKLSDLRESGSLEQDADIVIFISRDDVNIPKEQWEMEHPGEVYPPPAELLIAKHRNGPTGEVKIGFNRRLTKFINIPSEEPSYEEEV